MLSFKGHLIDWRVRVNDPLRLRQTRQTDHASHLHTHTLSNTGTHTQTLKHTDTHIYTPFQIDSHTFIDIHAYMHIHPPRQPSTQTHTYLNPNIETHTHTLTHIHILIHTPFAVDSQLDRILFTEWYWYMILLHYYMLFVSEKSVWYVIIWK